MSHFYKYISVLRLIHVYQFFMFLSKFVMINFMVIKGKSLIYRKNMLMFNLQIHVLFSQFSLSFLTLDCENVRTIVESIFQETLETSVLSSPC